VGPAVGLANDCEWVVVDARRFAPEGARAHDRGDVLPKHGVADVEGRVDLRDRRAVLRRAASLVVGVQVA